jgi:3-ketosteroid 9alpha-monooxygenase subunit A
MSGRFPFTSYPQGWFQVAYADELRPGGVVPLRYFGRDLVLFRTEQGVAHALDAFCPHLGAHLGYGGTVAADSIRCPFHGWRFDGEGQCVEAPDAAKIPSRARLDAWPLEEANGLLFLYHGPDRSLPSWKVPALAEYGSDAWSPYERRQWRIRTHVQEIAENIVDPGHFRWVHRTLTFPRTQIEPDGHAFRSFSSVTQPTPRGPVEGRINAEGFGLGFWTVRFSGITDLLLISAATPIDDDFVDLRLSFAVKRGTPPGSEAKVGAALIAEIARQVDEDVPIWEHKIYRTTPALTAVDAPVAALRKWSAQFLAS